MLCKKKNDVFIEGGCLNMTRFLVRGRIYRGGFRKGGIYMKGCFIEGGFNLEGVSKYDPY